MVPIVISAAGNQPGIDPVIGVAAVSTVGYGGLLMGPPLIGLLAHEIGLRWALLVLVGLCLLLALRADLVWRSRAAPEAFWRQEKSAGGAGRRRFVVVPDQSSSCMCDCR